MGLLIFYVANVANVANVIQVHFVGFSNKDCWIFQQLFPAQKRYLCTEFQSALKLRKILKQRKLRKQRKRIQETMSLPLFRQRNQSIKAEFNLLLRSQMPTMLIYAKIAAEYGISEDRVRKIIRSP